MADGLAIADDGEDIGSNDFITTVQSLYSPSYNDALATQTEDNAWRVEARNGCPNAYIPLWPIDKKVTSISQGGGQSQLVFDDGSSLPYTESVVTTSVTAVNQTQALASDRIYAVLSSDQPFLTYRTQITSGPDTPTVTVGLLVDNFVNLADRGLTASQVNEIKAGIEQSDEVTAEQKTIVAALPASAFSVAYSNPDTLAERLIVSDYEGNVVSTTTATADNDGTATLISFEIPVENGEGDTRFATFNVSWAALFTIPNEATFPDSVGAMPDSPRELTGIISGIAGGLSNPLIDEDGSYRLSNCVKVLEVALFARS